jgi:hypothetical protein
MTEEEMFALPFDEYIRYRTEFAIERNFLVRTAGVSKKPTKKESEVK